MSLKQRPVRQGEPGDHIRRETVYLRPENRLKSGFVHRETPLPDKLLYEKLQGKAYQGPTTSLTGATMNRGLAAAYPGGQVKPGEPSSVHHGNLMPASPDPGQPPGQSQAARLAPAKSKEPVTKRRNNSSGRGAIPAKRKKASKRKGKQTEPEVQPDQLCEPDQEILFNELIRHRFLYLDFTCRLPRFRNIVFNRLPQRLQGLLVNQKGLQKRLDQLCKQGRRTLKTQGPLNDLHSPGNGLNQLIDTWNKIFWGRYYAEFRNGIEEGISVVKARERGNEALDDFLGLSSDNVADISNFADIPDIDGDHSMEARDTPGERASSEDSSIPEDEDDDDDDDKATTTARPTLAYIVPVKDASSLLDGQHPFQPPKTRKGKKKVPPIPDALCSDQPRSNQPFTSDIYEFDDTDGELTPSVRSKETNSGVPSSSSKSKRKRDCSSVGTVTHDSPMASLLPAINPKETPTSMESARPTKKRKRRLPTTKPKALPTAKDEVIVIASDDGPDLPATQSHGPSSRSSAPRSGKHGKGKSASSPEHRLTQELTPPHSTPCPKKSSRRRSNGVSNILGKDKDPGKRLHDSHMNREEESRRMSKKELKRVKKEPRDEEHSYSSEDEGNVSKCGGREGRKRVPEQQVKQQKQRNDNGTKKGEKETNRSEVRGRVESERRETDKKMRKKERKKGKKKREQTSEPR